LSEQNFIAVIPAWNEELSIGAVLEELSKLGIDSILVDDGSNDSTVEQAKRFNAIVIQHKTNMGYELALSSGVHKAAQDGYKYAVTIDADGQIGAEDVIKFVEIARKDSSDLVIGIRSHKNRFFERLLCLFGQARFSISDPLCGIKLYNLEKAKNYFPFDSHRLVGMELAFRMADGGAKISQTNINIRLREGHSRIGNSLKGELIILRSLFKAISIFGLINFEIKEKIR
jgi:glycosyltransferase involved in cell wall biosynthesis